MPCTIYNGRNTNSTPLTETTDMLPPHPTDEHRLRARVEREAADAKASRGVTRGDVLLLSGLAFAVVVVLLLLVTMVFF